MTTLRVYVSGLCDILEVVGGEALPGYADNAMCDARHFRNGYG